LHFNFGFATRYQPALVGLAVIGVVDTAGPGTGRILLHGENADADNLAAAQAWGGIFIVCLRLAGLGVDRIF